MEQLVPNFGEGGSIGVSFVLLTSCPWSVIQRNWYTFFCLTKPILQPEIFESGENIGLDPLLKLSFAHYCLIGTK